MPAADPHHLAGSSGDFATGLAVGQPALPRGRRHVVPVDAVGLLVVGLTEASHARRPDDTEAD
jgi:hypothetical protein